MPFHKTIQDFIQPLCDLLRSKISAADLGQPAFLSIQSRFELSLHRTQIFGFSRHQKNPLTCKKEKVAKGTCFAATVYSLKALL